MNNCSEHQLTHRLNSNYKRNLDFLRQHKKLLVDYGRERYQPFEIEPVDFSEMPIGRQRAFNDHSLGITVAQYIYSKYRRHVNRKLPCVVTSSGGKYGGAQKYYYPMEYVWIESSGGSSNSSGDKDKKQLEDVQQQEGEDEYANKDDDFAMKLNFELVGSFNDMNI